ncbi:hypothetical protein RWE87_04990 [Sinorhizobium meliloti]|uniref:hypothetical protein n=1 Tax=Rhizobium meliloti TaxID=382 RepID=UPI00299F3D38|nr:hypothetical protein [Sinorhizobium meliloti]
MTEADLIAACLAFEEEHGVNELLVLLNDTLLARAQAAGVNTQYLDAEDDEMVFHTVQ